MTTTSAHSPAGTVAPPAGAFADLLAEVRAAGLLRPRPGYYVCKTASNLALLGGAWWLFVRVGDSWWQLAVAVLFAFCYTQTGMMGHDLGHRQVTRRPRLQSAIGIFHGNLLLGFSFHWWVGHHNRHHAHPNHLELDSDITRRRVIFVPEQGFDRKGRAKQFIVRHQHILFFPLLSLEAVGLRVASVKAVRDGTIRHRRVEGALIAVHLAGYFTALFLVLSPGRALAFLAINQLLFGLYLGSIFAPNHKGMPMERPDDHWDWMTRQIRTARNIRSGVVADFLFGGVNFQIEHHLFPGIARPNLRRTRAITLRYCAEHNIPYHETSTLGSYAEVLRHLRRTSRGYQAAVASAAAG